MSSSPFHSMCQQWVSDSRVQAQLRDRIRAVCAKKRDPRYMHVVCCQGHTWGMLQLMHPIKHPREYMAELGLPIAPGKLNCGVATMEAYLKKMDTQTQILLCFIHPKYADSDLPGGPFHLETAVCLVTLL